MRDIRSNIDAAQSLQPAARTATGTGAAVDLQGYGAAFGLFHIGAWTDGTHTPKLQDSDDGTTFGEIDAGLLIGSFTAVSGTGGQNAVQRVGYLGGKRYVRGFLTVSGATSGALSAFSILRGRSNRRPLA